jgi:hypothetical protein
MRTYDPADRIRYVHMAPGSAAPSGAPDGGGTCDHLPTGYANRVLRGRLTGTPETGADAGSARPALVVLPGGAEAAADPGTSHVARTLRLA